MLPLPYEKENPLPPLGSNPTLSANIEMTPPSVGPVGPVTPVGPVCPIGPISPVGPVGPVPKTTVQSQSPVTGTLYQLGDRGSPSSSVSHELFNSFNFLIAM